MKNLDKKTQVLLERAKKLGFISSINAEFKKNSDRFYSYDRDLTLEILDFVLNKAVSDGHDNELEEICSTNFYHICEYIKLVKGCDVLKSINICLSNLENIFNKVIRVCECLVNAGYRYEQIISLLELSNFWQTINVERYYYQHYIGEIIVKKALL